MHSDMHNKLLKSLINSSLVNLVVCIVLDMCYQSSRLILFN